MGSFRVQFHCLLTITVLTVVDSQLLPQIVMAGTATFVLVS